MLFDPYMHCPISMELLFSLVHFSGSTYFGDLRAQKWQDGQSCQRGPELAADWPERHDTF